MNALRILLQYAVQYLLSCGAILSCLGLRGSRVWCLGIVGIVCFVSAVTGQHVQLMIQPCQQVAAIITLKQIVINPQQCPACCAQRHYRLHLVAAP